jgi:hypothetical protein
MSASPLYRIMAGKNSRLPPAMEVPDSVLPLRTGEPFLGAVMTSSCPERQ